MSSGHSPFTGCAATSGSRRGRFGVGLGGSRPRDILSIRPFWLFLARMDTPRLAGVAQLVEQLIRNQQVDGSSPFAGSTKP
jgi:hypothetical protein